ncbi:hypothetical protein OHB27_40905 [Streptomyces virginiae]|nr:hypothetical protein [Streptomyces virginiae]MCX5277903.1 hypothetical protein [Streptomyces virginiae]
MPGTGDHGQGHRTGHEPGDPTQTAGTEHQQLGLLGGPAQNGARLAAQLLRDHVQARMRAPYPLGRGARVRVVRLLPGARADER